MAYRLVPPAPKLDTPLDLIPVALWLGFLVGWFMNIYSIVSSVWGNTLPALTGTLLARLAGFFYFPLGGVLGYF
jgi:hypothetical protein